MAEDTSGKKRPLYVVAASWVYDIIAEAGWPRQVLLAVAAVAFIVIACILFGGSGYREDPAALAPPSASLFVETRDLNLLLKNFGSWELWNAGRRIQSGDPRNPSAESAAGAIGAQVPGLGARLPLLWLSAAKAAALAVADGETPGSKAWAVYLRADDPASLLKEIRLEPALKLDAVKGERPGMHELTGTGNGSLILGVTPHWLVISSDKKLPAFALENRPSYSLAAANALPEWGRNVSVRAIADPAYLAGRRDLAELFAGVKDWVNPKARLTFASRLDAKGGMDLRLETREIADHIGGSGVWPLVKFLLFILGLACLALVLVILAMIVGWSGWLKAAAVRAGIAPADSPAPVTPSAAFSEDAGVPSAAAAPAPAAPVETKPAEQVVERTPEEEK